VDRVQDVEVGFAAGGPGNHQYGHARLDVYAVGCICHGIKKCTGALTKARKRNAPIKRGVHVPYDIQVAVRSSQHGNILLCTMLMPMQCVDITSLVFAQ
jgi:hypothetical protein